MSKPGDIIVDLRLGFLDLGGVLIIMIGVEILVFFVLVVVVFLIGVVLGSVGRSSKLF